MHNITKRGQLKKLALALGLSGTFFLNACTSNAPSNQTIVTSTDDYEANLAANESESFYETESETFDRETLYRTDDDNKPAEGWITNADGTMGYCQNGYLLTGYQMIDNSRYLFSDDGIMQTGRYTDENGDPCTVRIRLKAYPVRGTAFVDTWTKTGGFSMHLESEVPLGDAENIPQGKVPGKQGIFKEEHQDHGSCEEWCHGNPGL